MLTLNYLNVNILKDMENLNIKYWKNENFVSVTAGGLLKAKKAQNLFCKNGNGELKTGPLDKLKIILGNKIAAITNNGVRLIENVSFDENGMSIRKKQNTNWDEIIPVIRDLVCKECSSKNST